MEVGESAQGPPAHTRLVQGEHHKGKRWGSTQWDKTMQVCRLDQGFKGLWWFSCCRRLGPPSPLVIHMSSILIHGTCVYRLSQCCDEILAKSNFKQGGLNFARSFIVYCGREVMAAGASSSQQLSLQSRSREGGGERESSLTFSFIFSLGLRPWNGLQCLRLEWAPPTSLNLILVISHGFIWRFVSMVIPEPIHDNED